MSETDDDTAGKRLVQVAVAAGVVWTAASEYALARTIGASEYVAPFLPVALDVYMVAAIRRGWKRDLFGALAIMGCAQIAAHLLQARAIQVSVPLVTIVAMLVPISIWRPHALREAPSKMAQSATAAATKAPRRAAPNATENAIAAVQSATAGAPESATVDLAKRPTTSLHSATADAMATPTERPGGGIDGAQSRAMKTLAKRPAKTSSGRSKGDVRGDARAVIRALYDDLEKRPVESDMVAALKKAKLPSSRQFANARRLEIERDEPHLVELGNDNVRSMTGS